VSRIVVVGSINVDIVNRVETYPVPGQTIKSASTEFYYGGKGSNQAVAAARAGGSVAMVGAVGTDSFGKEVIGALQRQGIDTSAISAKAGPTGMASILVDRSGQNQIVLAEGANGAVTPMDVPHDTFEHARLILLQNEIGWETNFSVLNMARTRGIPVVFNPAPALVLPEEALPLIGTLVLNESEAEFMSGMSVGSVEEAELAARHFLSGGVSEVIVTLGAQGSLYMDSAGTGIFSPSFPVKAVDTTSAGDTFIGYYAAGICVGKGTEEALQYASAAAALSVTRSGAQASIPAQEEVVRFINVK
jgi:ribokinase